MLAGNMQARSQLGAHARGGLSEAGSTLLLHSARLGSVIRGWWDNCPLPQVLNLPSTLKEDHGSLCMYAAPASVVTKHAGANCAGMTLRLLRLPLINEVSLPPPRHLQLFRRLASARPSIRLSPSSRRVEEREGGSGGAEFEATASLCFARCSSGVAALQGAVAARPGAHPLLGRQCTRL